MDNLKLNEVANQQEVIFELNDEAVFETTLATCQHSIIH